MATEEEVGAFIDGFLEHSFYDPQKAHEYYMRVRKLLGRQPHFKSGIKPAPKQNLKKGPPHSQMDFNDKVRLDTSQIRDRRAKNDPTRSPKNNPKVDEAKKKLDRVVSLLERVRAQKKKTHLYDLPKKHKLSKIEHKLLKEYNKQYAIVYKTFNTAS